MGIALDPNFATNGWVYVYYAPDSANNSDPGELLQPRLALHGRRQQRHRSRVGEA